MLYKQLQNRSRLLLTKGEQHPELQRRYSSLHLEENTQRLHLGDTRFK
jgi:hypothetical protein